MGRVAAANKAKKKVSEFLRGSVLSMKNCVLKHMDNARASVNERSLMSVENLRNV